MMRLNHAGPNSFICAILAYGLLLFASRVLLSPYLEIDEAQFMGAVDLRLTYANSHPPLYNWLVRGALELTGWHWAASVALVKYALLTLYHLAIFDAARRLRGIEAGIMALCVSALMPQIVWMSVHTLAHSVMVMSGCAIALWGVVRMAEGWRFGALATGFGIALAALAKYNFIFFAVPLIIAIAVTPAARERFSTAQVRTAVFAAIALIAVPYAALMADFAGSAGRIGKLERINADLAAIDIPYLGVDGAVEFALALLATAGPPLLIWAICSRFKAGAQQETVWQDGLCLAFQRMIWLGLSAFLIVVLLADFHSVRERYLTPLLIGLPVVLAVRYPLSDRVQRVLKPIAFTLFLAAPIAMWGITWIGKHRWGWNYDAAIAVVLSENAKPAFVAAEGREDDRANFAIALGWPPAKKIDTNGDQIILKGSSDGAIIVQSANGKKKRRFSATRFTPGD